MRMPPNGRFDAGNDAADWSIRDVATWRALLTVAAPVMA
jgi:hypothetical protein